MKSRRILSLLLVIIMAFSLLPVNLIPVFAEERAEKTTSDEKNITLGTTALKGAQQSNVYFGNFWQSSLGSTEPTTGENGIDWIKSTTAIKNGQGPYYKIEPIKWRVLDTASECADTEKGIFLLSDQTIDVERYNKKYDKNITWAESTMRSWLNGYDGQKNKLKIDYSQTGFIGSAFSDYERSAVADTRLKNDKNPIYNIGGGNDTTDKVFLLSIAEVQNKTYGFTDNMNSTVTRIATKNAYVVGGGETGSGWDNVGDADFWLLRSPGGVLGHCAYVGNDGAIESYGDYVSTEDLSVRPALNLKSTSVLFTSAAKGGKSSSVAGNGVTGIFENRSFSEISSSNDYKLTLIDESRSGFEATLKSVSDNLAVVAYLGASVGENEYISVIIKNGDTVRYYGRVAKALTNGKVTFSLPNDFSTANGDVLCVFNEQYNGDYYTDYASNLIMLEFDCTDKPAISGIVDGKNYCSAQMVTVNEKYVVSVTVNDEPITLDENNQFILYPARSRQKIVVTDKFGERTEMTVTINESHTGGIMDCTHKAVCEFCGEEYGNINAYNHSLLNHIGAKAANTESEGNKEYWYCKGCNRYFSDKYCKNEIKIADIVIEKLVENDDDTKSPQTGDDSHMTFWLTLLFMSGGGLLGTAVLRIKRKETES